MNYSFLTIFFQLTAFLLGRNNKTIIARKSIKSQKRVFKIIYHVEYVARFDALWFFPFP